MYIPKYISDKINGGKNHDTNTKKDTNNNVGSSMCITSYSGTIRM